MSAEHQHHSQIDEATWAKSLILFGMGIYLAVLIFTGNLANYINLRFAWLAYVGTALFFLLALANLYACLSPRRAHSHHHIGWDSLLIVAFPLLLALLIPSRSLGVEAVSGGIGLSPVGVEGVASLNRNPLDRNILDWLRAFNRASTPAAFNGQPVDVSGFVYREPRMGADEFMVSRFTMSCCVADAYPIGMPVRSGAASDFAPGAWVRVRGEVLADLFGGEFAPIVLADAVDSIEEPAQPYLYP
ncbi:MAG: TIGR03943 family protein [Chloroflexi bacterium]|nr:TIGR03943 family protein [Chloroflexota bacterium]